MNTTAIAQHLNVLESSITRCEEWAHVLFVVVKGLGARFVSKKVNKLMTETRKSLANKVVGALSNKYGFGQLKVWDKKTDELRVYVKKNGYVSIKKSIDLYWIKGYKSEISELLKDLVDIKVSDNSEHESTNEAGLAKRYGWAEVADAQADVARENFDI